MTAAGGTSRLPATGSYHPWGTVINTGPRAGTSVSRALGVNIQQRTVSGELFSALEIPILAGRTFDDRDDARTPGHAVVSANFARQAFPDVPFDGVIGQRITVFGHPREIVGVVGDVALDVYGASTLIVYHAHRQFADDRNWALSQVVSADGPAGDLIPAVRAIVADLDPELVVHRIAPLADVVGLGVGRERFALVLMGAFAGTALLLAVLGLYSVVGYAVRQRVPEIAIRIAVGATTGQIHVLVFRQAVLVLGLGLGAGMLGAVVLGSWLSSLLFEIGPTDPPVVLATASLLAATGLVAAWLPARRASRTTPRIVMQEQ